MNASARLAAWILFGGIVFVTLSPIGLRPETGLPPWFERFAAFLLLGLCAGLGTPRRIGVIVIALIIAAGLLEAAQTLVPGRDGLVVDWLVKSAGAIGGCGLAFVWARWQREPSMQGGINSN